MAEDSVIDKKNNSSSGDNWGNFIMQLLYQTCLFIILAILGSSYIFWTRVPPSLIYTNFPTGTDEGYTGSKAGAQYYCRPKCQRGKSMYKIESNIRTLQTIADVQNRTEQGETTAGTTEEPPKGGGVGHSSRAQIGGLSASSPPSDLLKAMANSPNGILVTTRPSTSQRMNTEADMAEAQINNELRKLGGVYTGGASSVADPATESDIKDKSLRSRFNQTGQKLHESVFGKQEETNIEKNWDNTKNQMDAKKIECENAKKELSRERQKDTRNSVFAGDGLEVFPYNLNNGNPTSVGTYFSELVAGDMILYRKLFKMSLGWSTQREITDADVEQNNTGGPPEEKNFFLYNAFSSFPDIVLYLMSFIIIVLICILAPVNSVMTIIGSLTNGWKGGIFGLFYCKIFWILTAAGVGLVPLVSGLSMYQTAEILYLIFVYPFMTGIDNLTDEQFKYDKDMYIEKLERLKENDQDIEYEELLKEFDKFLTTPPKAYDWSIKEIIKCNVITLARLFVIPLMIACSTSLTPNTTLGIFIGYFGIIILSYFFPGIASGNKLPGLTKPASAPTTGSPSDPDEPKLPFGAIPTSFKQAEIKADELA